MVLTFSSNSYLNRTQMKVNASYIMNRFLNYGWTKNSIAGMLGNMETESTINPGVWQNLDEGNLNGGYGLVQWTPASKYINWANSNGYNIGDIDSQIARIIYELDNGLEYYSTSEYPETFIEFTQSTKSPEYLASAFLKNYERAGVEKEQERRNNARYWFNSLTESEGGKPHYPTDPSRPITSPYGWREINGVTEFHAGIDIGGGGVSYPIYATQSGVITVNRYSETGGYMVYIEHTGDEYHSRYLHLATQSPLSVGSSVQKGQIIGMMGDTGVSYGIHLHFEVATSQEGFGTESGTIDPEIYLQMEFENGEDEKRDVDIIQLLLSGALDGW